MRMLKSDARRIAKHMGWSVNHVLRVCKSSRKKKRGYARHYTRFRAAVIKAVRTCDTFSMPFNESAADSGYSYRTGRLDHKAFSQ